MTDPARLASPPHTPRGAGECTCGGESRVLEVRHAHGWTRRRLECRTCRARWTTRERREERRTHYR